MHTRHTCRVMVTGAGSGVGQGIVKALRASSLPVVIVSADIAPLNAALYRADEGMLIPKVEEHDALEEMVRAIQEHKIQVVMVGSEFDLNFFSLHRDVIRERTGAHVLVSPIETVEIADDKYLTAEFLREAGLPYPKSKVCSRLSEANHWAENNGYPLIVKTRRGTSSRHVHVVRNEKELTEALLITPNPMLQEMIEEPSSALANEYTCSVFKAADGAILGPFTARRTLRGGSSHLIEVAQFREVEPLLLEVGKSLDFCGSLNAQLMVGRKGPVVFELNARFSGTTAVRAHYGFNEPEMALRSFFYGEALPEPKIGTGVAMRYLEEVFIDNTSAAELVPGSQKGVVRAWF